jgi:CRISPR type III-A-associated protein Csm2
MSYDNRRQTGGPPPEKTLDQIWPGYLKDGYFDEQGNLRLGYVSRDRVVDLVRTMANATPALTTNQLRRFFGHCRNIEAALKARRSSWESKRAEFQMLDVAAADAFGKREAKIPRLFHDFIRQNVAAVQGEKDFLHGFLPHFEALVGFGSQFFDNQRR